jgi:hypothetical protein
MPNGARLLLDTDVMIDFLRAHAKAVAFIQGAAQPLSLSVLTVAELYMGVREGDERSNLERTLTAFNRIELDERCAMLAGLFVRDYGPRHSVELPDALIGATAQVHGYTLVTLNRKHYPMLRDVLVPYTKP